MIRQNLNLSEFDNIFCDSAESLKWAYKNGLSRNTIIRTSSPALLWKGDNNIVHVESCWNVNKMRDFQSTIQGFTEDVYDSALSTSGVTHEEALCVSRSAMKLQNLLFKAACLVEDDFNKQRLFLKIDGSGGPNGNNMNSPWDILLKNNPLFETCTYKVKRNFWNTLNTKSVSLNDRIRIAGLEAAIFRISIKLMKYLPDFFYSKEALVVSENELIIETSAKLALSGVKITKVNSLNRDTGIVETNREDLLDSIDCVILDRIQKWVTSSCVETVKKLFDDGIKNELKILDSKSLQWRGILSKKKIKNRIVLMNSPGNTNGQALSSVCKDFNIPIISAQHGVTFEISNFHKEISVSFESTTSDCVLTYNRKSSEAEKYSHFSKGNTFIVGMSERHVRMHALPYKHKGSPDILYISTNLYKGNIGACTTWLTDYDRAKKEQKLIKDVFNKLPVKVRYKTYPEDNRRYIDSDPVVGDVKNCDNIDLFDEKIDTRYLLSEHRLFVTSMATSTLGWPVMSGKPVVFINCKENSPLSSDAYESISKGIFVFNDDDIDFHENLRSFLSKPLCEIERLWSKKKNDRKDMIEEYFSSYISGAGSRAKNMIKEKYL